MLRVIARFVPFALLLAACSSTPPRQARFSFRTDAPSPKAKIFLVAGSSDSANFAQEIIDQTTLWLSKGFKSDEISCYYSPASSVGLDADWDQFIRLLPKLSDCRHADVLTVRRDLLAASARKLPFFYLYMSSHGDQPITEKIKAAKNGDERDLFESQYRNDPGLDTFYILVDAKPLKSAVAPPNFFTPKDLREILASFPTTTPKVVILQGCHSGGFLDAPPAYRSGLLTSVPNLTLLTASRFDRTSFGCQVSGHMTTYGAALLTALTPEKTPLRLLDWASIHKNVSEQIQMLEVGIEPWLPSEPQFFSNRPPTRAIAE